MAQLIVKALAIETVAIETVAIETVAIETVKAKQIIKTEDLGKEFEKAICMVFDTPYVGPYKYTDGTYHILKERLAKLPIYFPGKYIHTAEKGSPYDFTFGENKISAKTTKKDGKVAPQVIGQPSVAKFCDEMTVPFTTIPDLKQYIQAEIMTMMPKFEVYTFNTPIIYYNKKRNILKIIKQKTPLPWPECNYTWTNSASEWKNSSTLKIARKAAPEEKPQSILEIQFHNRGRQNMAIRWSFENVLNFFPTNFNITDL